jgi:hypothetical protein
MSKLKALNIFDNKGFWPEKTAVLDGINEVLSIGQCTGQFPVRDYGRFQSGQWRDENNNLVPWQSVDWYVYDALNEDRMQVDSSRILHDLTSEPWRDDRLLGDHYDLFVMEEDMYDPADGERSGESGGPSYSVGASRAMAAAVISTHRIEHIWGMPYGCTKTEVMRRLCFMFGVPSRLRSDIERARDGIAHCKNVCILRRAEVAPDDWERLTADRLKHGALCEHCTEDLRQFFLTAVVGEE